MHRLIWIIVGQALCCGVAVAQDHAVTAVGETGATQSAVRSNATPKSGGEPSPLSPPRPLREIEPALYYLKDKDGNLLPAPGFHYDDFKELYNLKNQLEQLQQRPRYTLQQMAAVGTVSGQRAELTIRFKILIDDKNWVRVPLRLEQAVLAQPVQYEGPGQQFTHFEENGEGYVAWIRGRSGEQHELTLKVLVGLSSAGEGTRLRLFLPRATSSDLKFTLPSADVVAKVSEGATLLDSPADDKLKNDVHVIGLGGDFELSWRAAGGRSVETPVVLEAEGRILARIDSRNIDTEASLTVRSYGEPFDRFRVRLPRGAELIAGAPAGYTVAAVETGGKTSDERLVEVRLGKRTTGPVEVQLNTRRAHEIGRQGEWLELSGFDVVKAARQWGHIAVAVVGDWHVLWGEYHNVRQVDQWPESLGSKDVLAGFEYFLQPCSLTVRLVPRNPHVNAETEYRLSIDADQAQLETRLKYTIRGAKIFELKVKLGDWQFDEVQPEHIGAEPNPAQVLSIPLQPPATGPIELTVRAHRPWPPGKNRFSLTFPQPIANSLGPATLFVQPADNVELTPDNSMPGLSLQPAPPQPQPRAGQQEPLFYRGDAAKAVFAGVFSVQQRAVAVDVQSQARVDAQRAAVEQRLNYTIRYEPIERLELEVPRVLAGADGFTIRWQDQPLTPVVAPGSENPGPADSTLRMWVVLPKASIGDGDLTLRYGVKVPALSAGKSTPWRLPLVMPVDGKLSGNKLRVVSSGGVVAEMPPGSSWSAVEDELPRAGTRQRSIALAAGKPLGEADFVARLEDQSQGESTVIERAWIQTWLYQNDRKDRAVFRVTSNEKELEVAFPEGAALSPTLLLDGKPLAPRADGSRIFIDLPGDGSPHPHVIEMDYSFTNGRPPRGELALEFPRFAHDPWTRRFYWQLVLPRNENMIIPPQQFTCEFTWGWSGYFWGRQPLLEQSQLETWVGARHLASIPEGTTRYLFSGLGRIHGGELRTAGRAWIVLVASTMVLIVGLAWIYVPATRHPAALLLLAVLLLSLGVLYPEATLLMAQAASLGLLLALVAALLRRSLLRRPAPTYREPSQVILEKGSTQPFHPLPSAGDQPPTGSSPAVIPSVTLDWNV
jgi:hypothetical protein